LFKVSTIFRFYDGSENQIIDPLIGSVEGIANTPAYRGLALAVFENLELAEFGNRIPFLTFEILADFEPIPIGSILSDASTGDVASSSGRAVIGYAAYGSSVRAAIEPLIDSYSIDLFDDGTIIRGATGSGAIIAGDDMLGNSADGSQAPRIQREQGATSSQPAVLRISYYDPARDFQSGEARAAVTEQNGREECVELPAVLTADEAKGLVHEIIARRWAKRDLITLRLPPAFLDVEPGEAIELPLSPQDWTVEKCTIDAYVVIAELSPR